MYVEQSLQHVCCLPAESEGDMHNGLAAVTPWLVKYSRKAWLPHGPGG